MLENSLVPAVSQPFNYLYIFGFWTAGLDKKSNFMTSPWALGNCEGHF